VGEPKGARKEETPPVAPAGFSGLSFCCGLTDPRRGCEYTYQQYAYGKQLRCDGSVD
jgi:hypothetical protein